MKKLSIYFGGLVVYFSLLFHKALAQELETEIPEGVAITLGDLKTWITAIYKFMLFAGGAVILITLIYSAILYATAGADETRVKKAKGAFKSAIIGALILLGIGTIIGTIVLLVSGDTFTN